MLRRPFASLALAFALCAALGGTALASEALDAMTAATKMEKAIQGDEAARTEARKLLDDYCKSQSTALSGQELSRMDTAYLGVVQSLGSQHDLAIATLRKALADKRTSKYVAHIQAYLVESLQRAGKWDLAVTEIESMAGSFAGTKQLKKVAVALGLALRGEMKFAGSVKALQIAVNEKDVPTIKFLVNSCLLANNQEGAIQACEAAIAKAKGDKGAPYEILLRIVKLHGKPIPFEPVAYAPGPAPKLKDKVKVISVWNPDAGTLKWTMGMLENIRTRYAEHPVEALAVTTYYKKDADTRQFVENMTPETEQVQGVTYRDSMGFQGQLAYMKDEAAIEALGRTALPYVLVLGKDDKVLFAHVMDRSGDADIKILYSVIENQLK